MGNTRLSLPPPSSGLPCWALWRVRLHPRGHVSSFAACVYLMPARAARGAVRLVRRAAALMLLLLLTAARGTGRGEARCGARCASGSGPAMAQAWPSRRTAAVSVLPKVAVLVWRVARCGPAWGRRGGRAARAMLFAISSGSVALRRSLLLAGCPRSRRCLV